SRTARIKTATGRTGIFPSDPTPSLPKPHDRKLPMKKSKLASGLAGGGGVLALALGLSMTASQVAAVPYASQIRFGETQINKFLNTDLLYTLNEDADAVTVEVYNLTDDVVVRTYQFEAPDPETQVGRHAISWDNRDEEGNLLPLGPDQFTIRVRVQ